MAYRILLINWRDIEHPEAGGAEVHAHEIFHRIVSAGHEVTFLCCAWPGCQKQATLDGIRVIRIGSNFTFNYSVAWRLRSLLASPGFDIIIEDVNKIPFCTPRLAKLPRLILFHHLFGTTIFREVSAPVAAYVYLWERLIPLIYRSEWVQAVSQDTAAELAGMGFAKDKIRVVYNGIDCNRYAPAPEFEARTAEEPYFLYMGRIKKYKRLELILQAFSWAVSHGLDSRTRLVFAGSGDDYPRLKASAGKLGVQARTNFLGRVSEKMKINLLQHALCVVNSSPKEGWGITNMEASACGTPVIASNSPGLRESVKDGESGFLFNPGDTADFGGQMVRLASDAGLRGKLGQGARRFAETFNWDDSARKTLAYIGDILAKNG
jgi:glycosyltransferase involved in cell wall biosynthesis